MTEAVNKAATREPSIPAGKLPDPNSLPENDIQEALFSLSPPPPPQGQKGRRTTLLIDFRDSSIEQIPNTLLKCYYFSPFSISNISPLLFTRDLLSSMNQVVQDKRVMKRAPNTNWFMPLFSFPWYIHREYNKAYCSPYGISLPCRVPPQPTYNGISLAKGFQRHCGRDPCAWGRRNHKPHAVVSMSQIALHIKALSAVPAAAKSCTSWSSKDICFKNIPFLSPFPMDIPFLSPFPISIQKQK